MVRKSLILKILEAASMQRWNDKIRPVELRELDKQAHKMIIAYALGKFEEGSKGFKWINVIEGGIFEFLQRLIVTDLKPQLFYRIKENSSRYKELNKWVYQQLDPILSPLGHDFARRFKQYISNTDEDINKRLLGASHFYATKWEFDIIKRANPGGYEMEEIESSLKKRQDSYSDLRGFHSVQKPELQNFLSLCGQLRFQVRWSHMTMIPRTSVLGHMLFVAILTYFFSLEIEACKKRQFNNFFTALFHDLPEVLTRDIISPIKRSSEELEKIVRKYEKEMMNKEVFKLIPPDWHSEMNMFTENEFKSIVTVNGKTISKKSEEINKKYNKDKYSPRDGEIIRAADHLSAFVEAYSTVKNGMTNEKLTEALWSSKSKYKNRVIGGINLGEIYADFD